MSGVPELADYKYGFHEDVTPVYETGMGLSEEVVRTISKMTINKLRHSYLAQTLRLGISKEPSTQTNLLLDILFLTRPKK